MAKFCNTNDLKNDIRAIAAFMGGAFLLGALICFFVVRVAGANSPDMTTAQIATIFAAAGGGTYLMIFAVLGLRGHFEMAVCMSQTRKSFLCRESVETVILTTAALLFGIVLYKIDDFMQNTIYRGHLVELDVRPLFDDFLLNPINFVTVVFAVLGLHFLFGVLYMKFGQKFLWGCWAVWMFLCLGAKRIAHTYFGSLSDTMEFLSGASKLLGGYFWQLVIWIVAAVLFSAACLMLRKQEARGY